SGSQKVLNDLGADGAVVDKDFAKTHHLALGSPIPVLVPSGQRLVFHVRGIFDPPSGGSPFGAITISSSTFDRLYTKPQDQFVFLRVTGGVTPVNTAKLDSALNGFP